MSADASSFSIFTATMVKDSYGSSPGALQGGAREETISDEYMHTGSVPDAKGEADQEKKCWKASEPTEGALKPSFIS